MRPNNPDRNATTAKLSANGRWVVSPADRFVEAMEDADGSNRLVLATRAIRRDPGCVEARLVLADASRDRETRLRHLQVAVDAGDALWSSRTADDLAWWYASGTRPYMRAIAALGLAHRDDGREDQALACFHRLLKMNPNDPQGIRHLVGEAEPEVVGFGW